MTNTIQHCWSCGEHHAKSVMCPAHEMRTTGQAWAKAHKECERRKPDRPPWSMACSGCHCKGNPGQADIRSSGIKMKREAGLREIAVHVWAPDIAASEHCQGVPDRRKPKREHVVRGPDRRLCTTTNQRWAGRRAQDTSPKRRGYDNERGRRIATRPEPGQERCKRGAALQ